MKYLYVKQIVEDFDEWLAAFASHAIAQEKVGLSDPEVMRDAFNPNIVTCIFKVKDLEKAKAFAGAQAEQKSDIGTETLDEPVIRFMEEL